MFCLCCCHHRPVTTEDILKIVRPAQEDWEMLRLMECITVEVSNVGGDTDE